MHPLLQKLNDIAWRNCDVGMIIVYPSTRGWAQMEPTSGDTHPEFCRLVQSSAEGAKHCRMCHLLVSIAACNGGERQPRCHAGASILLTPVHTNEEDCLSVVSTCMSLNGHEEKAREEARRRAEKLGIHPEKIADSLQRLPHVSGAKLALAQELMAAAGEAVGEIWARARAEERLDRRIKPTDNSSVVRAAVERELKGARIREALQFSDGCRKQSSSLVVEIVSDLVKRKPSMPFTLSEIAAAARITPNHFSHIFHQHHNQRFSDFVAEQRMSLARELLQDLTLNVAEVASQAGFEDPGYFARRFRQKNGMSPREWRCKTLGHQD